MHLYLGYFVNNLYFFKLYIKYKAFIKRSNQKIKMLKKIIVLLIITTTLISCKGPDGKRKFGADARKFPDDPALRVQKNLEEGRGFRLNQMMDNKTGVFDFASSNELWRASLDVIDFMPLSSVNYSGGIIITDWYSSDQNQNESIKISIRFLTNEIRSDALDIKVFTRKCIDSLINCKYVDTSKSLITELKKEILKKAEIYKRQDSKKDEKKKN